MENPLETLLSFYDFFQTDAEPRGRFELSEMEKDKLERLANGQLCEREREEIIPLLAKNEVAMEFLADLLNQSEN